MKLAAVLAGTALALVPTGTAFAGQTGNGKALGNCQNSSAGGVHAPLRTDIGHGNGNGGLRQLDGSCAVSSSTTTTVEAELTVTEPVEPLPSDV